MHVFELKRYAVSICFLGVLLLQGTFPISAEEGDVIRLLPPQLGSGISLMQSLKARQSHRSFSEKELPLGVLSNLLWASSGINRKTSGMLTVPSAHNNQEIDVYVAMKSGVYRYNRVDHSLDRVLQSDIRAFAGKQNFTSDAPVDLIFVADYAKMSGSESEKVFYSAVDTGYMSQNVYLYCASEGLATVVLGWVDREQLHRALQLRDDQGIILTQPVGYSSE